MPFTIGNYIQKNLSTGAGWLRAAVLLLVATAIGGGVIFGYGVTRPKPAANTSLTDVHIAQNFTAVELTSGCVNAGTGTGCVQIISGVTNHHFIFTKSGGLIVGAFASPTFSVSGALVRVGGGWPTAGEELSVAGDMSGSTLVVDNLLRVGPGGAPTAGEELAVVGDISGSTVRIDDAGDRYGQILCAGTGGKVGRCTDNDAANCGCIDL